MSVRDRDIAFVRFEVPDLDVVDEFLTAFGLQRAACDEDTLYMRGTDDGHVVHVTHLADPPGFVGLAFEADGSADLEILTRDHAFPAAAPLDGPGGGRVVWSDPNGFHVEVVADRDSVGRLPAPAPAPHNAATAAPRTGPPVRLDSGPSHVKRLGHRVTAPSRRHRSVDRVLHPNRRR